VAGYSIIAFYRLDGHSQPFLISLYLDFFNYSNICAQRDHNYCRRMRAKHRNQRDLRCKPFYFADYSNPQVASISDLAT
jgi:hypothetical protein